MTTEIDFDSQSVELFRRLRVLVRVEYGEPIRQKPDRGEDLPLQLVRVPEAVIASATAAANLHSQSQIESSAKGRANPLAHRGRGRTRCQPTKQRLGQTPTAQHGKQQGLRRWTQALGYSSYRNCS